MADCMTFPKTANEFIEQYSFKDKKQEYTNGAELIPVFRVKQMMEHYCHVEVVRCKDCKHCTPSENIIGGYGDCNRFERDNDNSIVCEDDFCSYGERKDNERKAD